MPILRLLEEGKEKGGTVFLNNLYCKIFLTKLYNLLQVKYKYQVTRTKSKNVRTKKLKERAPKIYTHFRMDNLQVKDILKTNTYPNA